MQHFRIPQRLDYIKLPSLRQTAPDAESLYEEVKTEIESVRLRTDLMLSALNYYRPDVFLVDRSPYGEGNELKEVLDHISIHLPQTRQVLLLGDIVDSPETTYRLWGSSEVHHAIHAFYDFVLLTGSPEMFEASHKYPFPGPVSKKVRFCLDLGALSQITRSIASILPNALSAEPVKRDRDFVEHIPMSGSLPLGPALANS
jgi:predicted glycosyltransferase